jgi:hypothetical protein
VSGRFTSFWLGVVQPHGYADSSSEWASTVSATRRGRPLKVRPTRAARPPSGATSVRLTRVPSGPARSIRTYPGRLSNVVAFSQVPSTPNQSPSRSLTGGVQKPPISPRMCQPVAGYVASAAPTS